MPPTALGYIILVTSVCVRAMAGVLGASGGHRGGGNLWERLPGGPEKAHLFRTNLQDHIAQCCGQRPCLALRASPHVIVELRPGTVLEDSQNELSVNGSSGNANRHSGGCSHAAWPSADGAA